MRMSVSIPYTTRLPISLFNLSSKIILDNKMCHVSVLFSDVQQIRVKVH